MHDLPRFSTQNDEIVLPELDDTISGPSQTYAASIASELTSPSLVNPDGAFELKFVISDAQSQHVLDWSRIHLAPDPHCGSNCGDGQEGYFVNSLYLDTPELDIFHRTGKFGPRKFRLRRYGSSDVVWLEMKHKRRRIVRKRRVAVVDSELQSHLLGDDIPNWEGHWYRHRLERHDLRPICRVTYRRFARIGHAPSGAIRLTLDDQIRGQAANSWWVPNAPLRTPELMEEGRILELKFRGVMPALFRSLIMDLDLLPGSFSKYREATSDSVPLSWLTPNENIDVQDYGRN